MNPFDIHQGLVAVLDRNNVDTDAIMPKQFMKSIERIGFGQFVFDEWRYLDAGELGMDCSQRSLNSNFELNHPRFNGASILLSRLNFGCGSSREHAVWGLKEYGFKVIIAESFGEIFYDNCLKNGILALTLPLQTINLLIREVNQNAGYGLTVNLQCQQVMNVLGDSFAFDIAGKEKTALLNGWDPIDSTLESQDKIVNYEHSRESIYPWLYR